LDNSFKLKLLTTLPQMYKCHVEQQTFYFFMLIRCIVTAIRTKTSMV